MFNCRAQRDACRIKCSTRIYICRNFATNLLTDRKMRQTRHFFSVARGLGGGRKGVWVSNRTDSSHYHFNCQSCSISILAFKIKGFIRPRGSNTWNNSDKITRCEPFLKKAKITNTYNITVQVSMSAGFKWGFIIRRLKFNCLNDDLKGQSTTAKITCNVLILEQLNANTARKQLL